jgi:hypothetical protein
MAIWPPAPASSFPRIRARKFTRRHTSEGALPFGRRTINRPLKYGGVSIHKAPPRG